MSVTASPKPKMLSQFSVGLILAGVLEGVIPLVAIIVAAIGAGAGTGLLVGGAAAALGALVGFIFGIPRVLQDDQPVVIQTPDPTAAVATQGLVDKVHANTNLEQVSDWLTKIIVGVTLVQVGSIPGALGRLGAALRGGFGDADFSAPFAIGLIASPAAQCGAFRRVIGWERISQLATAHSAAGSRRRWLRRLLPPRT